MKVPSQDSIKGNLLYFSPSEQEPSYFTDSLLYICDHGEEGALGLIINRPLDLKLKDLFNVKLIFSEYGMAELLSQSYFTNKKHFESPPWKKIIIRDKTNPLNIIQSNKKGCINIIDLANIHSCGFIATNDTGQRVNNGFHIIGRQQGATIRGCDLMT